MTEREWLTTTDAGAMWRHMAADLPSDRKCVDIVREMFRRSDDRHSRDFGTQQPLAADMSRWLCRRDAGVPIGEGGVCEASPPDLAPAWCRWSDAPEPYRRFNEAMKAAAPAVLRGIYGNPFRPVRFLPEWRTPAVLAVAGDIDADFDPASLPVLADALEEAGCDDPAVLNHLRGRRLAARYNCGCEQPFVYSVDPPRTGIKSCKHPLTPDELRWEDDPDPVRCAGDWVVHLALGRD